MLHIPPTVGVAAAVIVVGCILRKASNGFFSSDSTSFREAEGVEFLL